MQKMIMKIFYFILLLGAIASIVLLIIKLQNVDWYESDCSIQPLLSIKQLINGEKNITGTVYEGGKETKINYRPVHKTTLTSDVQYFPPQEGVY